MVCIGGTYGCDACVRASERNCGRAAGEAAGRGDRDARRRLIEAYLGLVAAIARRYARWGVPLEDLVQEGAVALIQAIDHYDPGRGMQLSTYVTWWVKQAIRRATISQSTPVRIPERLWERAGEAAQAAGVP
jgi:RNA polymerase primary sigma factor